MNNEESTQGNPEAVDNAVLGSEGDDFFSALEDSVNSMVQEPEKPETKAEATPENQGSNQTVETEASVSQSSDNIELDNLKKRYSDSSREAQNLRAQLNELKPFVPVLDAMKKDSGLVNHVRDYFESGGELNSDVKKQLNLDDDFSFDAEEMLSSPDSDSRIVFNKMVDNIVSNRLQESNQQMANENQKKVYSAGVQKQASEFMERHGMTSDEFNAFTNEARERIKINGITFEDMYLMVNQGKVSKNVANSTKEDMLNQMKNVRDIPASQSGANSKAVSNKPEDGVFDVLKNLDGGLDDMFG